MENILEFIIRGVGMIIAVAAITFFISSQSLLMGIVDRESTSDFYNKDNATQQYEDYILGHELISQIYNGDNGIDFNVLDSSRLLAITITGCADLSQLTAINLTSVYDNSGKLVNYEENNPDKIGTYIETFSTKKEAAKAGYYSDSE